MVVEQHTAALQSALACLFIFSTLSLSHSIFPSSSSPLSLSLSLS